MFGTILLRASVNHRSICQCSGKITHIQHDVLNRKIEKIYLYCARFCAKMVKVAIFDYVKKKNFLDKKRLNELVTC